jgi:type VI secretion system FHA domain protein
MALRLEIISAQRQQLGNKASFVVEESGCSIGRSLDNDWALPDIARFLSGRHAVIHFRGGEYFLEDTSTNGTFVNDSVAPLGKRGTRVLLHSGDVVRIGEYRILVHLDERARPTSAPDTHTQAHMTVETVVPLRDPVGRKVSSDEGIDFSALVRTADATSTLQRMGTKRQASDADLGDALTIDSLLIDLTGSATARSAGSATVPQASIGDTTLSGRDRGADHAGNETIGTLPQQAEQDRVSRLRSAAKMRLEGTGSMPALDLDTALDIFCRGAGIDASQLSMRDEAMLLQLAGRMLRETMLGLKEILRAQQDFVDRNGIEREAPEGRSPLDANMDEYLLGLFAGHEKRQLDAVMQLRDQFAHASRHAAAVDPALRAALTQFLGHLAPERLATGSDGAANWNRYRDVYGNLLQATGGRLPHLFLEALSQAYQDARGRN